MPESVTVIAAGKTVAHYVHASNVRWFEARKVDALCGAYFEMRPFGHDWRLCVNCIREVLRRSDA